MWTGQFDDAPMADAIRGGDAAAFERAALQLHLVRGLPAADHHLADPAHGLRVRGDHRERAQIVQDVFGGDRFPANPRLGEGNVFMFDAIAGVVPPANVAFTVIPAMPLPSVEKPVSVGPTCCGALDVEMLIDTAPAGTAITASRTIPPSIA